MFLEKRQRARERTHYYKKDQTENAHTHTHNNKPHRWRGKEVEGGDSSEEWRKAEEGGPGGTELPKPRSIVMKMAVHMTTMAAE